MEGEKKGKDERISRSQEDCRDAGSSSNLLAEERHDEEQVIIGMSDDYRGKVSIRLSRKSSSLLPFSITNAARSGGDMEGDEGTR